MADIDDKTADKSDNEADGYAVPAERSGSATSGVVRAYSQPGVSPAEWAYERVVRQIAAFEAKLEPGEEVGGKITAAPGDGAFQIEDVGWWGPDMIIFYGKNAAGRPMQLVQHYTQLNVLLQGVPKSKPDAEPRRIGFELASRLRDKAPVRAFEDEAQRPSADSAA